MPDRDVRALGPEAVDAIIELSALAFHEDLPAPEVERRRRLLGDPTRRLGVWDGDALVGTASAYEMELSVPGGASAACPGIAFVAVRPTHRRRGLLRAMMDRQLRDLRDGGAPLAALWAAENGIYGRYGYGLATRALSIELRADRPLAFRIEPDPRPLRMVDWTELPELADGLLERLRARRAGMPSRTAAWWRDEALRPHGYTDDPDLGPLRVVVLDRDGYAAYRTREGHLEVVELAGDSPAVEAALWRYLASIDLIDVVSAPTRPVDDPLPLMLASGYDSARVTAEYDALWLRLLDVPAALRARAWAAEVDVTLELTDALLVENAGTWRLVAPRGPGGEASCERAGGDGAAADLRLDVAELAAAYLGGTPLSRLAAAGLVEERTPGALERLDAALRTPLAPFVPEHF